MWLHVVLGDNRVSYRVTSPTEVGSDPDRCELVVPQLSAWQCSLVRDDHGRWQVEPRPDAWPMMIGGAMLPVGIRSDLLPGAVLEANGISLVAEYLSRVPPPAHALSDVETDLIERVATDGADDASLGVLADYWQERGDEVRGAFVQLQVGDNAGLIELADEEARLAEHATRWREPLLQAGFLEQDLVISRGILQWPASITAGEPLDGHADLLRLSPRYYREHRKICDGPEAIVWAADAVTPASLTPVAIKVPRFPTARRLLEREQAILRRLDHRNISRCLGWAIRREGHALVFAWGGIDLRKLLADTRHHERTLGPGFALSVAVQLCEALEAMHAAGIVHREIRSDHVLVGEDGIVTLIDFGYVGAAEPRVDADVDLSPGPVSRFRLAYLSREQVEGRSTDGRTDLFSTALLACELVASVHPTAHAQTTFDVLRALRDGDLRLPPWHGTVEAIVRRALARRDERYATAAELREDLVRAARGAGIAIGPQVIAQVLVELGVRA